MKAILGRKVGMTQVFNEGGRRLPVTVLELGPCVVHQIKTAEKDGYRAVQLGFGAQKAQRVNKALGGHLSKAQRGYSKAVHEVRLDRYGEPKDDQLSMGDVQTFAGMFEVGSRIDVVGWSMGKGFAGVMKRHGMKGAQTNSHGTHEYFRHGGSIGCRKFPGRVFKNKRMAGHMGMTRVMQEGLEVIEVRENENILLVKGSVPGPRNGEVFVRRSLKAKTRQAQL